MNNEIIKKIKIIEKGIVPDGYKKTSKASIVPNEWESIKFDKCVKITKGQVDPKEMPYCNMVHIGLANIEKRTGRLLYTNIAKEEDLISNKYYFDKDTILYGKIRPELGKVLYVDFEGICSADIYPLKPLKNLNAKYLKYLIMDNKFYKFSVSTSMRTGMPKINREDLATYSFLLPPKNEQEKISTVLELWDKTIELKEKLLEEKQKQKKGLMERILTGKVRLKGYVEIWNKIKLADILEVRNDKSQITDKLELFSLTIEDGVTPKTDRYNREFLVKEDDKKYKITKYNDIVYNPANLRFGAITLNKIEKDVLLSPIYETLYIKDSTKYDIDFIGAILTSDNQIKRFSTMAEGTLVERMAVKVKDFINFKIIIPDSIEEQKEIAKIINSSQKEINLIKEEIELLKEQKKGLMQLLLTGIVRVKCN